jgi:hypothetical protein
MNSLLLFGNMLLVLDASGGSGADWRSYLRENSGLI